MPFTPAKFYVLKGGETQTCLIKPEIPTMFGRFSEILRDRRKLLVEITRSGTIFMSLRGNRFILTSKQFDTIHRMRESLKS